MKTLLPQQAEVVDLVEAYAIPSGTGRRPFVRCNMISTLDGAITINGRSGLLGGPRQCGVFQVLRSLADIILVGAGTARAEGYGQVTLDEQLRRDELPADNLMFLQSRSSPDRETSTGRLPSSPRPKPGLWS